MEVQCHEEGNVGDERSKAVAVGDCSGNGGYWGCQVGLEVISCGDWGWTYVSKKYWELVKGERTYHSAQERYPHRRV